MTLCPHFRPRRDSGPWHLAAVAVLGASIAGLPTTGHVEAAAQVAVWDSSSPFTDTLAVDNRTGWTAVPRDLLELENDPSKARSDPGYYGREYSFRGDAVVENHALTAVFWSAQGRVVLYARRDAASSGSASAGQSEPARKVVEIVPRQAQARPTRISRCRILQNGGDQVILEAGFSAPNSPEWTALFSFDKTEIVEVRPGENVKGMSLLGPIEYGVVPSLIADDLILSAADSAAGTPLCVPSESVFLGLLPGEDCVLALTWPKGKQQVRLGLGQAPPDSRRIESVEFDHDVQSLYLAALRAPGIWHREPLKPSYLEKDVTSQWRRPFPARWRTQLMEGDVRTSFTFRNAPGQIWRGVAGFYDYPVWFDGDRALYHLSKKVPSKGDSLIYFVEGETTPESVLTPVDMVKATLGRPLYHTLLDPTGRTLRTHHRRGGLGVRRACTCGCTEAIQKLFDGGREVESREEVSGAVDDMIYFVQRHVARIDEYRRFADDLLELLASRQRSTPELKPFLDRLAPLAQQIPQECSVQKDNMRSLTYADQLAQQTRALTTRRATNNLAAYQGLSEAWRAMGGAQDYVLARCHITVRRLFQEAGYGCVNQPAAVDLAQEIRERCLQCLKHPDGYEIWPDY